MYPTTAKVFQFPQAEKSITVRVTKNYGVEAIYPVCPQAALFAQLVGTKTLTRASIETIKALGYSIEVAADRVVL
jgi:hypothetical protein